MAIPNIDINNTFDIYHFYIDLVLHINYLLSGNCTWAFISFIRFVSRFKSAYEHGNTLTVEREKNKNKKTHTLKYIHIAVLFLLDWRVYFLPFNAHKAALPIYLNARISLRSSLIFSMSN